MTKTIDQQLTIGTLLGGTLLDTGINIYFENWSVGPYDGLVDYAGTSGFTVSESSGLTTVQLVLTGSGMASYIGSGQIVLPVHSHASFTGSFTGGNGSFINSQGFVAEAKATHNFSPVPVPAAVWLLASGLVGLVGLQRKHG